jgi:integrase
MTALRDAIEVYLSLRRRLGLALIETARLLRLFAAFADHEGVERVTTDVTLRWATQSPGVTAVTTKIRYDTVRRFAEWWHAADPLTEVPPEGMCRARYHRKPPTLFQDTDLPRLLAAARQLPSARGLRRETYATLFGLLSVTGLRISEALALDDADLIDRDEVLRIRQAKCGKSRLVPVHASTLDALARYAHARDRVVPGRATEALFVSETGVRISLSIAEKTFARVAAAVGLRAPFQGRRRGRGARLHDLRHHFAIRTVVDWYRTDRDVDPRLPILATYLGHVHVQDTYWYLEAVPELLALAADRAARRVEVTR